LILPFLLNSPDILGISVIVKLKGGDIGWGWRNLWLWGGKDV
jgi:hypothetical protein